MAQNFLQENPRDPALTDEVQGALTLKTAKKDYASYVQQISRIKWLKFGDENTKVSDTQRIRNSASFYFLLF